MRAVPGMLPRAGAANSQRRTAQRPAVCALTPPPPPLRIRAGRCRTLSGPERLPRRSLAQRRWSGSSRLWPAPTLPSSSLMPSRQPRRRRGWPCSPRACPFGRVGAAAVRRRFAAAPRSAVCRCLAATAGQRARCAGSRRACSRRFSSPPATASRSASSATQRASRLGSTTTPAGRRCLVTAPEGRACGRSTSFSARPREAASFPCPP
mmetsp:Transcript_36483/g.117601  ORF Transcript_36483/g.117601 Transcript_36483/m.117601 type:complete len:208 (-) Transcript_36483:250-873(-)